MCRPYKEVKGNHPKTSYQQKPRRFVGQVTTEMGCWPLRVARGKYFLQIFDSKMFAFHRTSEQPFFYISQRPWCFLFCMFHVFDVQDMETFNVAAQNFVSEAGSENGISEWAEKIMDPVGVSLEFPPE